MTKDEALELALEALEVFKIGGTGCYNIVYVAIAAIKEALAQDAQAVDWKDQYEKQKRRAEMWLAKYEEVAGPAPYAVPLAPTSTQCEVQPEPSQYGSPELQAMILAKLLPEQDWKSLPKEDAPLVKWAKQIPPKEQQSCDKRPWIELTAEDIHAIWDKDFRGWISRDSMEQITQALEAKLKEKNGVSLN